MMIKRILKPSCYLSVLLLSLAGTVAKAEYYDFDTANETTGQIPTFGGVGHGILTNPDNGTIVGTGYFDPFIRTQVEHGHNGSCGTDCEQGYNTDGTEQFDTKDQGSHNWNHSISYGDLQEVDAFGNIWTGEAGGGYLEFLLDINEPKEAIKRYISLDELQFFVTDDPNLSGYNDNENLFFETTETTIGRGKKKTTTSTESINRDARLVWELDKYVSGVDRENRDGGIPQPVPACDPITAPDCTPDDWSGNPDSRGAQNNAVRLNYSLHSGSGKGIDLIARISTAAFEAQFGGNVTADNAYIVLFNRFGDVQNAVAEAGFEEWAYRSKSGNGGGTFPGGVPEPSALALMGIGMLGMIGFSRRKMKQA